MLVKLGVCSHVVAATVAIVEAAAIPGIVTQHTHVQPIECHWTRLENDVIIRGKRSNSY